MRTIPIVTNQQIHDWLLGFDLDDQLHVYVAEVVGALPNEPRDDLIGDPSFRVSDYDAGSGRTHQVPIGMPGRNGQCRSVVLKRSLRRKAPAFVRYVMAHELAHAVLRNGGRWGSDDPEEAADALAAQWGFAKPGLDISSPSD